MPEEHARTHMLDAITIRGARQHNLKGFDLAIPHRQLTVVTGLSGSGKSSLAFDTLYAEGQRRYVESLSTYARQFLDRMDRPDVEAITGIPPAIAIEQKNPVKHSRSTVGTATEIATYLRLLFARIGRTVCPACRLPVGADSVRSAVDLLLAEHAGARLLVAFPKPRLAGESWAGWAAARVAQGYLRVVVDGEPLELADPTALDRLEQAGEVLVVADRLVAAAGQRARLAEALEAAFREGEGTACALVLDERGPRLRRFTARRACPGCARTFEPPTPLLFSFNSPRGACPACKGFGTTLDYALERIVPDPERSLAEGAIDPFTKPSHEWWQRALLAFCRRAGIDATRPFAELPAADVARLKAGDRRFPGLDGFFAHLERKKYKMHVRVFLARYRAAVRCASCGGSRLRPEAHAVQVAGRTIAAVSAMTVREARAFFAALPLSPFEAAVARDILRQITSRLDFLAEVGLDYLTLDRETRTLSGGEAQRIALANQLGAGLTGTLYVLDEPSIGLHPRDTRRLVGILRKLADAGNTVVVVEHDREIIEAADHVVELGPRSGEEGGELVFAGPAAAFRNDPRALTPRYLRGELTVPLPTRRRPIDGPRLVLAGARAHNLKGVTLELPLGTFTCVTGVSGSGKSSLVHDTLWAALDRLFHGARGAGGEGGAAAPVGPFDRLTGAEKLRDAVLLDQAPIGRTPRSNPATYIKVWDDIRRLFAATPDARRLGFTAGHFSFNVPGGRCPACEGAGYQTIEMHFLADLFVTCEACGGRRFGDAVLAVRYRGRTVADVLRMTVREARAFFAGEPAVAGKLAVLEEVGLGYLRLGQAATTLSGGEAQRLKLARALAADGGPGHGVLYLMDEPTTGLHLDDVATLVAVFQRLVDRGNTLVVVEHHPDVIKAADYVVDLGPEGGEAGGEIVAAGRPEDVAADPRSHTGRILRAYLSGPPAGASLTGPVAKRAG
ncbi:MAG TPA: excinuclease ABC subunit UvrA [Thermodesulfobacteriota bacterium]|nr:excinuclease ABC subunit UvrA [Thermodesulfobacteriota bacterium]